VRIRTYGDLIGADATHPEAKSAGPDGRRCSIQTVGLLGRLHVVATTVEHIGKESNALEEMDAGIVRTVEDPTLRYVDERGDWAAAVPLLRAIGVKELVRLTGMPERTIRSRLNSGRLPRAWDRAILLRVAASATAALPS